MSGEQSTREWSSGSKRNSAAGKLRYDLIPPFALERLARVYADGAAQFGANNWRRGMPTTELMASALRHVEDDRRGVRGEDHLFKAIWNLIGVAYNREMAARGDWPWDDYDHDAYWWNAHLSGGEAVRSK